MVYAWKLPGVVPVDAQTAGDELSRIYQQYGAIDPKTVVNESRREDAPLHRCFEWDDSKAAEKYRCDQARHIIRCITIAPVEESSSAAPIRAFVTTRVTPRYEPIQTVLESPDKRKSLLDQAKRDMQFFMQKYKVISDIAEVGHVIGAMEDSLGDFA